jgi:Leucine-rich repeat (LRR) protein
MLAPKVKTLLLGGNSIKIIENLMESPELSVLELSDNNIDDIENLHAKIGQLTRLDLANNKIKRLVHL